MAASQICVYCIDLLTTGFHCWSLQDRLCFFASRTYVGARRGVRPKTKSKFL